MKSEETIDKISAKILTELKKETSSLGGKAKFVIIQVGDNPASTLYVGKKEEMAKELGIECQKILLPEEVSEDELVSKIEELNKDEGLAGIIVQLPLPQKFDTRKILDSIDPEKDIDGLNSDNLGKLFAGQDSFYPATPTAVTRLLEELNTEIEGKRVVVVGGSDLVGKPLGMILLNKGATITTCNRKTKNLKSITQGADILIVAIGKAGFIKPDMVKEGAVVVDIGINKVDGKVVGDVSGGVSKKASFLTPVPGGVGPLTVLALMENVIKSHKSKL